MGNQLNGKKEEEEKKSEPSVIDKQNTSEAKKQEPVFHHFRNMTEESIISDCKPLFLIILELKIDNSMMKNASN